ncbi:MAG: DNA-binding protein [Subdoligranulum variabile]|nr:MAG: DNA-binding protein [Subdoligranulum variabile]
MCYMYCNLRAEIARRGISRKELAAVIGCTEGTLSMKMNEKSSFTIPEAVAIKKYLNVDCSLDELFESDIKPHCTKKGA